MLPLREIVTVELLGQLASRSNLRYGKRLSKNAQFRVGKSNAYNLHLEMAGQGKPQSVELSSTAKGFRWKCSCTAKKGHFCEHCVAAGLHALDSGVFG